MDIQEMDIQEKKEKEIAALKAQIQSLQRQLTAAKKTSESSESLQSSQSPMPEPAQVDQESQSRPELAQSSVSEPQHEKRK